MSKRKIKNTVLMAITYCALVLFLFSACAIDSDSWIPSIICVVSALWLALMGWANDFHIEKDGDLYGLD